MARPFRPHAIVNCWDEVCKVPQPKRRAADNGLSLVKRMPVFRLDDRLVFPPPHLAEDSGIVAVGGDLSPDRLLLAYQQGIFPWYSEDMPILWHSPDPRLVLEASELQVSRSTRKAINRGQYEIRFDTVFPQVIAHCATVPRVGQDGTWITEEMRDAYCQLFQLGFAHSAEAWRGGRLVGGLYGVSLGGAFFGESMFALEPDASKVAFVTLVRQLQSWNIELIDCQVHTDHLARFGATEWPRERFLWQLAQVLSRPTRRGPWNLG